MKGLNMKRKNDPAVSLPLSAEEYTCHAPTTIFDQTGRAVAECSGLGNPTEQAIQHAAFIVQSANDRIALLTVAAAAKPIADRFAAIMRETDFAGHVTVEECTLPDDSITLTLKRREWESLYDALGDAGLVQNH